jgi:hypothetical protein
MVTKEEGADVGLGRVFLEELVRATSWAIVFVVAIAVLLLSFKQDIKEAIDFTFQRAIGEVYFLATAPEVKQDIKEAVEFMSKQSSAQVKGLLADPAVKQDIKEAIDLWHAYKFKKIEPTGQLIPTP